MRSTESPQRRVGSSLATRRALAAAALCGALAALPAGAARGQAGAAAPRVPAAPAATQAARTATAVEAPDALAGRPIARVEVEGNVRTDTQLILDQIRAQAGQNYNRRLVEVDTQSIAATERFITVRAEVVPTADGKVIVRYIVQERPTITAVEILGNQKKTDTQVREIISARAGGAVDPFVIATDQRAIEEMYRKDGYAFARVTVDQEALDKQGVVRYRIVEGPRAHIGAVRFDGNSHIKSDYLKWKIKTQTYIWIFRKGVLNEDDLDADQATIRDIYVGKGFLDAQVSRSVEFNADKSRATVRFAIVEGPKYKVGKITVAGNKLFSEAEIRGDLALQPGDYVERDRVEATQRRVEDRYGHEGYIYRAVDVKTTYTDQPGVVDLAITITEGEPYRAGRIIVRGNGNIGDRVVRRQIRIYPDQTYDTVLVRKSMDRLRATRLFSDVKVTPIVPPDNAPGVRDALVEVQEAQSGRFLIGAGVSTNSGLIGQISLEQQNFDITNWPNSFGEFFRGQSFKGAGQFFRILLEPGTEFQRYRVTFEEPYLFDTPYSFANDAYFFTRSRESWDEQRIGDVVTLGRRFGDVWSVSVGFRAEQVRISNVQDFGVQGVSDVTTVVNPDGSVTTLNDSAQQIIDQRGDHFLTSIKPGVVRDTTDSRIFPTTGSRASLALEQYGAMGGDLTMTKLTGRFDWYLPVYTDVFDRKTVFANRNEVGAIVAGDSVFYERFYAGGIGSLRGFRFRGVSPREGPLRDPVGGDLSWISTGEVNFPIYEEMLRGVVFLDVGSVESDLSFGDIRADAGLGFRVTIPFFGQLPLAVDFAVPVSKISGDRTQFVAFSLGIPF